MLKQNDRVPVHLTVLDDEGRQVSLSNYLDRPLVVYFYPKDDAPCCRMQAEYFRDLNYELKKKGVRIVGVSKDSVESHQKLKRRLKLNFKLLSDSQRQLQKAFGVWRKQRLLGETRWGTVKSTFLVDKGGKILKVWSKAAAKEHVREIYKFCSEAADITHQKKLGVA